MRTMAIAITLALVLTGSAPAAEQKRFESVAVAVDALIAALRADDQKALAEILGESGRPLVSSGDPVSDRAAMTRFVADYDQRHQLEAGGGKVILRVGSEDFPLPIPLVPDGPSWRWDTEAGKEEILNRRVGRNELDTIQVCLAYVDAQREYYSRARTKDGILEYAQRLGSSPGKRDGLYWPTKEGEALSPLGDLVVKARGEGYRATKDGGRTPYHGYFYKILTGQGPQAPGGAYDYVVRGHMIGGFALVAFPAEYGASGVMTFIVNHDGVVYQKDLGANTTRLAEAMKRFDPDGTWQKVDAVALKP
jgi:Protein of unknown function (DUF2950)